MLPNSIRSTGKPWMTILNDGMFAVEHDSKAGVSEGLKVNDGILLHVMMDHI